MFLSVLENITIMGEKTYLVSAGHVNPSPGGIEHLAQLKTNARIASGYNEDPACL